MGYQVRSLVRMGLGSGSTLLVGLSALSVPVTLVNGVLTARALGPADRGDYAAIVAFCSILSFIATAGIAESMILGSGPEDRASIYFKLSWLHALMLSGLFALPAVIYGHTLGHYSASRMILIATLPLVSAIGTQAVAQLIALDDVRFAAFARIVPYIIQFIGILFLLAMGQATLTYVLLSYWISSFIAAAICFRRVSHGIRVTAAVGRSHIRAFYRQLSKLSGSQVVRSVSSRVDLILVAWMLSSFDAGLYSVALSPVMAGTAVVSSLSPLVLKRAHQGEGNMASVSVFIALWVALGLAVVAPPFVTLLYGEAYGSAASILPYLALGFVANIVFDVSLRLTQARGATGIGLASTVVALAVQITAIVVLGLIGGIRGVAIGNAVGYVGGAVVLMRLGSPSLLSTISPWEGLKLVSATIRKHVRTS